MTEKLSAKEIEEIKERLKDARMNQHDEMTKQYVRDVDALLKEIQRLENEK